MHILACVFLLSCHPSPYTASRIALYSGAAFDITTTVTTSGHETNPVIGNGPPVSQIAIAGGLTVLSDSLGRELKNEGHPKAATIVNFVAGSLHFAAGTWNIRKP